MKTAIYTIVSFFLLILLLICWDKGGWQFGLILTVQLCIFYQLMQANHHLGRLCEHFMPAAPEPERKGRRSS